MGSTEGHEGRHVEGAHPDDVEVGMVGREAQLAGVGIGERRLRDDSGSREDGAGLLEDTTLGQRQDEFLVSVARHDLSPVTNARP